MRKLLKSFRFLLLSCSSVVEQWRSRTTLPYGGSTPPMTAQFSEITIACRTQEPYIQFSNMIASVVISVNRHASGLTDSGYPR